MIINSKNLIKLPVFTQGGDYLGQLRDFDIDGESGRIIKYHVGNFNFWGQIKTNELLISSDQVYEITDQKMVVFNALIKEKESVRASQPMPVKKIEPAITSKLE